MSQVCVSTSRTASTSLSLNSSVGLATGNCQAPVAGPSDSTPGWIPVSTIDSGMHRRELAKSTVNGLCLGRAGAER